MTVKLSLGFSEQTFANALITNISKGGVGPVDAVEQFLTDVFAENLRNAMAATLRKPPSVKLHQMYFRDRYASLNQLASSGYETWYVELAFSTAESNVIEDVEIELHGFELRPIDYGPAGKQSYRIRSKELKTQTNHILRLNHVVVPPNIFSHILRLFNDAEHYASEQYIANPKPGTRSYGFEHDIEGFEFVSFDHKISGERLFCSCAKSAHQSMLKETSEMTSYSPDAWPNQVNRLLYNAVYDDNICHLCIASQLGAEAASEAYPGSMQKFVTPYIDQLMRSDMLDKPTARAEVQRLLGISRWVRETELYELVKKIFPNQVVQREASPSWLRRLRLDIYVPDLDLAFEYQGEQHYNPVSLFGGEEAFRRTVERDELKKKLCRENGVHLVEIKFNQPLTALTLRQRLRRYLQ